MRKSQRNDNPTDGFVAYCVFRNQNNHFDLRVQPSTIRESSTPFVRKRVNRSFQLMLARLGVQGEVHMSGQVVLYFEDQADALRFALAAGSVMSGEGGKFTNDLLEETARATRIRLDAVNAGNMKKPNPVRAA